MVVVIDLFGGPFEVRDILDLAKDSVPFILTITDR